MSPTTPAGLAILSLALVCLTQTFFEEPANANDTRIDHLFAQYSSWQGPGAAIAVVQNGKVLHRAGYGLAELTSREKIASNTLFNLASDTKQFTAIAIAMLYDRGQLKYDDLLVKYIELPHYADQITIHHLIHHMSGLPDYLYEQAPGNYPDWYPEELKSVLCQLKTPVTNDDVIKLLQREGMKLEFSPGSEERYSNTGYVLLASIIERVSKMSFADFLRVNIFEPLQMRHTFVNRNPVPSARHMALSYGGPEGNFHDFGTNSCELIAGDGSVFSSIDDLILWARALEGKPPRLLKPESLAAVFESVHDNQGRAVDYGFGFRTVPDDIAGYPKLGEPMYWHDGEWLGFENSINYFPKTRTWIIGLTNYHEMTDEIDRMVRRIYALPGVGSQSTSLPNL